MDEEERLYRQWPLSQYRSGEDEERLRDTYFPEWQSADTSMDFLTWLKNYE